MNSSEMLLEKEYEIKYYEQNVKGNLKESGLLHFLQDIATLSAESLGFGPSFVFPRHYAWVVLKYHIELYSAINNFSSIKIKTVPGGITRLYAFRDFEIFSHEGNLLGRVISAWALIDMESRRMLPMQKVLDFLKPFEKTDNDLEFGTIDELTEITYQKEFEVRFDDIDINRHANNCNYIIWALETLPDDFRLEHYAKIIEIKFKKEVSLGAKIVSFVQKINFSDNIITLHELRDFETGEELTVVKIVWS